MVCIFTNIRVSTNIDDQTCIIYGTNSTYVKRVRNWVSLRVYNIIFLKRRSDTSCAGMVMLLDILTKCMNTLKSFTD